MNEDLNNILLLVSWGFLVDISLIILKFKKVKTLSTDYRVWHGSIMILVFILSLLAFLDAISNGSRLIFIINTIVFGATVLNTIGGMTLYTVIKSSYFNIKLSYLRTIHKYNGYIFWVVSKFILVYLTNYYFAIYFGFMIALQIYLHFHLQNESDVKNYKPDESKKMINNSEYYASLLTDINCGLSIGFIKEKYPQIKWVIFGNRVCDVTTFDHPGGNKIIDSIVGREISRFIFGGHKAENLDLIPHSHSIKALKLLNQYHIGDLYGFESILLAESTERESQQRSFRDLEMSLSSENRVSALPLMKGHREEHISSFYDEWTLKHKAKLGNKLSCFEFKNEDFKIKTLGRALSSYGRCFLVRMSEDLGLVRTYTIAQSMTQPAKFLLEDVEKHFESLIETRTSNVELRFPRESDVLTLFIKDFGSKEGLSKKIHQAKEGESSFIIEGPIGRGLNITDETSGNIYLICGGTGILAFMDFLYFYLIKMMNDIVKVRLQGPNSKFQELRMNFNVLNRVKKIHLIEVFTGVQDSYGSFLITKLVKINNTYDLDKFEVQKLISNNQNKLNNEYLAKNIKHDSSNLYYVCGPPSFNEEIPLFLKNLGADDNSIYLV
jgi:Cytochrome b5-like Heme/Steroid binding domain